MNSVSIYFPAGDFANVMQRYNEGREQFYQAHDEVARLFHDLLAANLHVNAYSFVTPERREERPLDRFRVISLGASDFSNNSVLSAAIAEDNSEAIVIHFPNVELLHGAIATEGRRAVVMANSFNRRGIRSTLEKWRVVSLLNSHRFELVSNHCLPATKQLAKIGVKPEKLIPWDFSHPFDPDSRQPKRLVSRRRFEAVYAGSINEGKGIVDLIRAIAFLRKQGVEIHCTLAGEGNIDDMKILGAKLGASDLLAFAGVIGNNRVPDMMAAADLVLVPSRREFPEGFPLAMFEAIASRTPIICSNHPMFREVMVDGRNASVFAAGDYRDFAAAIRRTLNDPTLYAALSENASLTWEALKGPADWRTLIFKWFVEGSNTPWIRDRMLLPPRQSAHI